MPLTLKYQGRQRERNDNGYSTTLIWTGSQEECEDFAGQVTPGSPGEEGTLESVRIYQNGGNIWNVERRYTTDQDGNFTNKPNVVYGRKSAQLHGGMLSIPIEQHKNYLTNWNFYLAAAPGIPMNLTGGLMPKIRYSPQKMRKNLPGSSPRQKRRSTAAADGELSRSLLILA